MGNATLGKIAEIATEHLRTVFNKEGSVIGVSKVEEGWKVELEVVDYPGAGFDPTFGLYEVALDDGLNPLHCRRTHLRRASQLSWCPTSSE